MSIITIDQLLSPLVRPSFRRREEDGEAAAVAQRRRRAMYLTEKPRTVEFYKEDEEGRDIMMEVMGDAGLSPPPPPPPPSQQQMMPADSSGEDHEVKAPKKRAETWVQEETRCLVCLRREIDALFNTSKSNKHLWEQISAKMRDKGFDRSPTMCTDKWRNLLKEFKKAKQQVKSGGGPSKMSCYKEIDELIKERNKHNGGGSAVPAAPYKSPVLPPASKVDSFMQFSDKGLEDAGISFGSVEDRSALNLDRHSDPDGLPLAITVADAVGPNGIPPWNWREASGNAGQNNVSYSGRVILVKWGDYTRKIGIDASAEAIKEAIKAVFGLRTRRAFWLEDEDEVVRCLDRDMPLGTYTLHLDEGLTIKICVYDESGQLQVHTDDKTLYAEEDFHEFLTRRGWSALREIGGFRAVDNLDELRPGAMYQGVVRLGE